MANTNKKSSAVGRGYKHKSGKSVTFYIYQDELSKINPDDKGRIVLSLVPNKFKEGKNPADMVLLPMKGNAGAATTESTDSELPF